MFLIFARNALVDLFMVATFFSSFWQGFMALWISFLLLFTRGILPSSFFVIFAAVAIFTATSAHSRPLLFFRVPSYCLGHGTILAVGVIGHVDNREDTQKSSESSQPEFGREYFLASSIFCKKVFKAGNDTVGGPSRLGIGGSVWFRHQTIHRQPQHSVGAANRGPTSRRGETSLPVG